VGGERRSVVRGEYLRRLNLIKKLTIGGIDVKVDPQTKWISLTNLWKAAKVGSTTSRRSPLRKRSTN